PPPPPRSLPDALPIWDTSKRNALMALSSGRYAGARLAESEARIDPQAGTANLRVHIDSGPVFHFGKVHATGLRRYPAWVVENFRDRKSTRLTSSHVQI